MHAQGGNNAPVSASQPASASGPLRVVLLLPLDNPLLRRAAITVRDAANAVFAGRKTGISVSQCAYGSDETVSGVVAAYNRCVNTGTDWVIGPLGRVDVSLLALAKLPVSRPTLMLSSLGGVPPQPMAVLTPDLEAEAELVARQAVEDACRKPLLLEAGGAIAARVSITISSYWQGRINTPLITHVLGARDGWRRSTDNWRREAIDCVLFAGGGAVLAELRPYLRNMAIYATSATFEAALDRTTDWTGVRVADAPWIIDPDRADFAPYAAPEGMSPTLSRLYALGLDAARLVAAAGRDTLPTEFDGAIGQLTLTDAQYRRLPMMGEFRERTLVRLGR